MCVKNYLILGGGDRTANGPMCCDEPVNRSSSRLIDGGILPFKWGWGVAPRSRTKNLLESPLNLFVDDEES